VLNFIINNIFMANLINYYLHRSYTASYCHRQIDNDIEDKTNILSRISKVGFQFLLLYKPAANLCNLSLTTIRTASNFSKCIKRIESQNFDEGMFSDAYLTSLSLITLAGTYFNFTIGIYLTTVSDISSNLFQIYNSIKKQDFEKALELLFQAISSLLYLGIMLFGSLEITLASLLIQVLTQLKLASKEFKQGRYLETAANIILAAIKVNESKNQFSLIRRRDALLQIQKYKDLKRRIENGREINELYDHPLVKLVDRINENSVILEDENGEKIDFGSHFFGYGKDQVKGMNLSLKKENNEIELEFKVNHIHRDKLTKIISELKSSSKSELNDLLKICKSHSTQICFSEKDSLKMNSYYKPKDLVISLKDIGSLSIGSSKDFVGLYDRVRIRLKKEKNLYDLHEVLTFFDLGNVLKASAEEDIDRMKIGQVFRMCCPKAATIFERTDDFFDLSLEKLKQKIIMIAPEMNDNFQKYLSRVEFREILPGRMRCIVKGLSDELYELGARGITSVITGAHSDKSLCKRIVSMFKMGALSTQVRHYANMIQNGLSPITDFKSGGSDSVFTQLITKNNESYNDMWYSGKIRLLYSLKALDTISYQYHYDSSGNRSLNSWWWGNNYLNRPNIFKFIERENDNYIGSNEIMIKERIAPEYIEGMVVDSDSLKNKIISALEHAKLLKTDDAGNKTIFGKSVDAFIQVGNAIAKG